MAAKSKNSGLKWNPDDYKPVYQIVLKHHTEREMRQEYTRLRDIAQKRLGRIGQSEFAESQVYKNWAGRFPMTKTIKDTKTLAMALADVANYVGGGMTLKTMKQQRARSLETLHEHGYTFVTKENYISFGQWMEKYRASHLDKVYDSKRAAALFNMNPKRKNTTPSRMKQLFEADQRLIEQGKRDPDEYL